MNCTKEVVDRLLYLGLITHEPKSFYEYVNDDGYTIKSRVSFAFYSKPGYRDGVVEFEDATLLGIHINEYNEVCYIKKLSDCDMKYWQAGSRFREKEIAYDRFEISDAEYRKWLAEQ